MKRHLGTGRDIVSPLDWKYYPRPMVARQLPAEVDLRRHCPSVYDQLHLNSCSANALAAALRFDEIKAGHRHLPAPSRLFIYFNERVGTGVVPMPTRRDAMVGGHAVLAVGYLHAKRLFIFRNSWGRAWGDRGYGYLPYDCVASAMLTWDFWTMRRVS